MRMDDTERCFCDKSLKIGEHNIFQGFLCTRRWTSAKPSKCCICFKTRLANSGVISSAPIVAAAKQRSPSAEQTETFLKLEHQPFITQSKACLQLSLPFFFFFNTQALAPHISFSYIYPSLSIPQTPLSYSKWLHQTGFMTRTSVIWFKESQSRLKLDLD